MLTPEQLATIKDRQFDRRRGKDSPILNDVDTLILACEQLQAALTAKDHVLSQFADSENWSGMMLKGRGTYMLWLRENPLDIANQALSEGKE